MIAHISGAPTLFFRVPALLLRLHKEVIKNRINGIAKAKFSRREQRCFLRLFFRTFVFCYRSCYDEATKPKKEDSIMNENLTYHREGDYLLPNVIPPENPQIGIWGLRRRNYLLKNKKPIYTGMLLSGKLNAHLKEIDRTTNEMLPCIFVHSDVHQWNQVYVEGRWWYVDVCALDAGDDVDVRKRLPVLRETVQGNIYRQSEPELAEFAREVIVPKSSP